MSLFNKYSAISKARSLKVNNLRNIKDERLIILYIRVSTDYQARYGYSLDEQERSQHNFIDYVLGEDQGDLLVLVDEGKTARNISREKFQYALKLCKEGKVKAICITDIDRFTRNLRDGQDLLDIVHKYDVQLVSPKYEIDTSTAAGRAFFNSQVNNAELESNMTSERTIDKQFEAAIQGYYPFGGKPPLGYKKVKAPENDRRRIIVPTEEGEAIITDIFEKIAYKNYSIRMLYKEIEMNQIFGVNWTHGKLYELSTKKIYYGTLTIDGYELEAHTEAIINEQLS